MWLDEIYGRKAKDTALCGKVSIGGFSPAAETDAEHRDMKILRAGGAVRIPAAGEEQLILRCGDGEYVILGTMNGELPSGMESGEIFIKTENASVLIKNGGGIIVEGDVSINGTLSLNGRSVDGA